MTKYFLNLYNKFDTLKFLKLFFNDLVVRASSNYWVLCNYIEDIVQADFELML